jgi:hypothetical protein
MKTKYMREFEKALVNYGYVEFRNDVEDKVFDYKDITINIEYSVRKIFVINHNQKWYGYLNLTRRTDYDKLISDIEHSRGCIDFE